MPACPYCSSSDLIRDGHDQRGRACGRHATSESTSLVAGHRFPRDVILLAVRYYLQLGAAAERIAGILADRGIDVSGRTVLRWVQTFGPALSGEIRRHRKPVSTTWLVDETYVKIRGRWHSLYRGIDAEGQVLDCWLSRTRDLAAAEAFFRRTISPTGCMPEHVVTDKASFYPSAIRACAPGAPGQRWPSCRPAAPLPCLACPSGYCCSRCTRTTSAWTVPRRCSVAQSVVTWSTP
jgi:transposase-like protein